MAKRDLTAEEREMLDKRADEVAPHGSITWHEVRAAMPDLMLAVQEQNVSWLKTLARSFRNRHSYEIALEGLEAQRYGDLEVK